MKLKHKLHGYLATGLLPLTTGLWPFWDIGKIYSEGWWGQWGNRLPYLVPMAAYWTFALLALTWPHHGGWIIFLVSGAFAAWRWILQTRLGGLNLGWAFGWFPISTVFVLIGIHFFLYGRNRAQQCAVGWQPLNQWWRRNLHYLAVFVPSILIDLGMTILFAPTLLSYYDDVNRGVWQMTGNGVNFIWAPTSPEWSEGTCSSQAVGKLLSGANFYWNAIAYYGVRPAGFGEKPGRLGRNATAADMQLTSLCRYLSEDGSTLMDEPQDILRMPTTDEIVRSLVRGGENVGCVWDGQSTSADCRVQPDKDAPLWNPDASPIYYSDQEYDEDSAWFVPYTGSGLYGGVIDAQPKNGGNSRHGFRCVREP